MAGAGPGEVGEVVVGECFEVVADSGAGAEAIDGEGAGPVSWVWVGRCRRRGGWEGCLLLAHAITTYGVSGSSVRMLCGYVL